MPTPFVHIRVKPREIVNSQFTMDQHGKYCFSLPLIQPVLFGKLYIKEEALPEDSNRHRTLAVCRLT